jgi:ribonuclease J
VKKFCFSLMPMGGVGEIGSNMTLIRFPEGDIIIDCGLLFPYESFFDINYLIPDMDSIDISRLKALVITHGHEDHIGALTHFIEKYPTVPIYSSPFTQDLIRRKTEERKLIPPFVTYEMNDVLDFDGLLVHPIHVTHSIPETFGLFLTDPQKKWGALYISDFKYDLEATHEAPFDIQKVKRLVKECEKTAFFIDSTNALVPGKTASENDLLPDLETLISGQETRLFITLFASNVHRIASICRLAKKHGRKIILMGRSVEHYLRTGLKHGYLPGVTEDELWAPQQVKGETGRMLIIVSGCQGDFQSALRRLTYGEDATFKLGTNDRVIFSSKVIPGNEKQISRIMNKITEAGAEVVTAYDYHIHASGHPAQQDLKQMLEQQLPDVYFPIHGESFFLRRHKEWFLQQFKDVPSEMIMNWHEVSFKHEGKWKITAHPPQEPIIIHGRGLPIERTQISQRRKMACQGTVFISLDRVRGIINVSTLGLPVSAADLLPKVREFIMNKVRTDLGSRQDDYARDQIKIATRQFYQQELGYKPVTEVHLLS